jgi:phosphoribosylformylglycinamidine synthase
MIFKVEVFVSPRKDVLDPQGKAVESALANLGYSSIASVRVGKYLTFSVESADENSARLLVVDACGKLLTNPIIEDYTFDIEPL